MLQRISAKYCNLLSSSRWARIVLFQSSTGDGAMNERVTSRQQHCCNSTRFCFVLLLEENHCSATVLRQFKQNITWRRAPCTLHNAKARGRDSTNKRNIIRISSTTAIQEKQQRQHDQCCFCIHQCVGHWTNYDFTVIASSLHFP